MVVHETIWHGIWGHLSDPRKAHIHEDGYVDAQRPEPGQNLSPDAAKLLIKKLKAK